jgi:hypothetical protein
MPKVTYVTYNEGIDAKNFHLGNLVHDYAHPKSFDPYVEKAYTDIAEAAPEWAESTVLENFALTLGEDDEEGSDDEDGQRYRVAAAAKSIKIDIKDSKKFFNDITLKSDKAKKWLASHLTAAESLSPHPKPEIWMLTGLILMTHATWTSLSSKQSFTPGLPAPFDPTGVTAIRRSSVSEHVRPTFGYEGGEEAKHIPGAVIHETGKYPGTRGWAAQWEKVDVKVSSGGKGGASNQIVLQGPNGAKKVVQVELQAKSYAQNKDEEEADDDEYWEEFLDAVEEDV